MGRKLKLGASLKNGRQFNAQGTFTTAAQNFKNFSTNLVNFRAQTTGCMEMEPNWREIGPTMETDNENDLIGAGLIHRMTFHPHYGNTNYSIDQGFATIYALSGFGGMWKSTNDGEDWKRLSTDNDIPFSSLGVLVIDPANPDRMYVTTGSPNDRINLDHFTMQRDYPLYTLGIYGTDDGGVNWTKINAGISTALTDFGGSIYNLLMDPKDHNNLIFTSTDGVYRCTTATGPLSSLAWIKDTQFSSLSNNDNQIVGLSYLTLDPTTDVWYVSGLKIYSTTTPFSGGNWSLSSGLGSGLDLSGGNYPSTSDQIKRINVFNSPLTGQTNDIYALIYAGALNIGIAKKTGTGNWVPIKYFTTTSAFGRSLDKMALVAVPGGGISPNNVNFYLGSNCYYYYNSVSSSILAAYPQDNKLHADIQSLYIHPSQTNKLWVASDGGISLKMLNDGGYTDGATYKNKGIQAQLLWSFDDSEQDNEYRLAALQDNGVQYIGEASNGVWAEAWFSGDGYGAQVFDKYPSDAIINGTIGSKAFNYQTAGLSTLPMINFGSYFSDPEHPTEKICLGAQYLQHTYGNGTSWLQSIEPPPANSQIILTYNSKTYNFSDKKEFYKGTYQKYYGTPAPAYAITKRTGYQETWVTNPFPSLIFKSTNGFNAQWGVYNNVYSLYNNFSNVDPITNALYDAALAANAISATDLPILSGISCKPEDGNKVWVCSSGLNPNFKIWKSTDGGTNWTNADIYQIFKDIPVFDILAVEGSSELVFAATLDGVYYTDNTMSGNWCRYANSPSVQTLSLKVNPCKNKLIVTTYGRGAFEVDIPFQPVPSTDITTTTWSSPMHFPNASVTVKSGNTLTIQNTTIYFGPNSRLLVEAGAKLIINNATLTSESECDGYLWVGVELQGNLAQKQILSGGFYPNHGWCVMSNNATIKNAVFGIRNYASIYGEGHSFDWSKLGGGVIQATNSKFINCIEGAKFLPYTNKNALNQPINDKSFFTTCQFLTDGAISIPYFQTTGHLVMWGTRGVGIKSNTFKNLTPQSFPIGQRGKGIIAWDATFTTNTPCNNYSSSGDCVSYGTRNTFENLFYGIDVGSTTANIIYNINVCTFTNNHRGIILRSTALSSVFRNNINIGDGYVDDNNVTYSPYGLYLDVCDAYNVKENVFNDATGSATDVDYGIIVSNTGTNANLLKQNTFSNVAFGIQAQEANTNLQLKCNKFTAATINSSDVKIMGDQMQGSIAQQQGFCSPNATDLPGNEFSHTCSAAQDLATNSNVAYQVTYNTRATISSETPQAGCYNTTDYLINGCSPVPIGEVCPPSGGFQMRMAQSNSDQELVNMTALIAGKKQLLDEGNSSQLNSAISSNGDETQLKQSLLQKGPYLSDQVLMNFLNHTPHYSEGVIKEVLIANSPLSAPVLNALNGISIGNKTKTQIAALYSGISQRSYVEKEIAYYTTARVLLYNEILMNVLNDTTNTNVYDTLYKKLDFNISPQSRNIYIGALIEEGKFGLAQAQVNIMRQAGEEAGNCDYLDALITLKQQSNYLQAYKTNATISSKINPQLTKWPLNRSVNALVLNKVLFGKDYMEQVYMDEATAMNQRYMKTEPDTEKTPENDQKVIAYPNPANNEITFKLLSAEDEGNSNISLFDIRGQLLLNFILDFNEPKKTISLENYTSGVYFYKIENKEKVLETSKLIIIK